MKTFYIMFISILLFSCSHKNSQINVEYDNIEYSDGHEDYYFVFEENSLEYSWKMIKSDGEIYNGEKIISFKPFEYVSYSRPLVFVTLEYNILNKSDNDIWLYDFQNGNLWQTEETIVNNNVIENKFTIYKELNDIFYYSWNAPKSIYISPGEYINGTFNVKYYVGFESNDWSNINIQKINFFILFKDITTENTRDEQLVKTISENYSKEYFVELPIKIE